MLKKYFELITMKYTLPFLICGLLGCCLGVPVEPTEDTESKVLNGRLAHDGEYPFMASVQWIINSTKTAKFCSASILRPSYILTAAHCFDELRPGKNADIRIKVGVTHAYDYGNNSQFIPVKIAYKHPKYVISKMDYDIAVLKLQVPLHFGPNVQPILLPKPGFKPLPVGDIVGWGRTDVKQKAKSFDLRAAPDMPVSDPLECSKLFPNSFNQSSMLCIGANHPSNACHGDSGGPLVQYLEENRRRVAVGIASYGFNDCDERPVVYTKVEPMVEFVREVLDGKFDKSVLDHVIEFLDRINPFSTQVFEGIDPIDFDTNFFQ